MMDEPKTCVNSLPNSVKTPTDADREAIEILQGFVQYLEETCPDDTDEHWQDIQKAKAWLDDQENAL